MKNKKPETPDRVGLSLHKDLVPHVLEKSSVLDMNPNAFVNACVEQCVNGMIVESGPGTGAPPIVYKYRSVTGMDRQPVSQRFNNAEYALLRALDEVLYDMNLAKDCVMSGKSTSAILSPAILELLQKYREQRSHLIAQAQLFGKGPIYPAPMTGI